MPRQARKESGTGIYHVMLRGINRQVIHQNTLTLNAALERGLKAEGRRKKK